ncbi:MAG: sugar phosphate isomerase/epimerase [Euzebyales bacterium]|nr:sugar phosphate isomerase/epimerase [Euzebyales bacterium]
MNPVGVHALVWVGGWSPQECELAVSSSKAAGYSLIEIPVLDPARIDTAMTRETLRRHGLDAACSLGLAHDTDISSEDPDRVAAGEKLLHRALDVTHDIGAAYLGGVLYSALGRYTTPPSERGRRNAAAVLRELAAAAARAGITLGIEPVNRYESNLVNTAEQALDLIGDVAANNVVVHLDAYHMNIEESDFRAPILRCGDLLGYVHVGESHRGYLGTGSVDLAALFDALAETGYTGPVTFESFSSAVVDPRLSSTLAIWRNLWSDGMDLATSARAEIASHLGRR